MHDKLASCEGLSLRLIGASGDSRSRVRISPCSSAGCNGHTAKRSLRGRKRYKSGTSLQHTDELKVQNTIEVFNGDGNTCVAL